MNTGSQVRSARWKRHRSPSTRRWYIDLFLTCVVCIMACTLGGARMRAGASAAAVRTAGNSVQRPSMSANSKATHASSCQQKLLTMQPERKGLWGS